MNTIEILKVLSNDKIIGEIFLGVFPIDKVPKIKKYPSAMIVNLDDSSQPGSHWVALYFVSKRQCNYFDSYGRPPFELEEYILQNSRSYTYNNVQVQRCSTITCGQMCLYFIVWRVRKINYKNIVRSMQNDEFVSGFIDGLYKIKTRIHL